MMNKTFEICNLVLAQADLMDLIGITQDENEYKNESIKIAQYIDNENPNAKSLGSYIHQIFIEYFCENFDLDLCEVVANCILKNLE